MKKSIVFLLELGAILSLYAQDEMTREEWEQQQRKEYVLDSVTRIEWQQLRRAYDEQSEALRKLGIIPRVKIMSIDGTNRSIVTDRQWDSLILNHRRGFFHTGYNSSAYSNDLRKRNHRIEIDRAFQEQERQDRLRQEEEERATFKKKYKYGWRHKLYKSRIIKP